ncbi:MAG: GAF domain-containing protein, partial [Anaerolineae bacterium]
MLEPGETNDQSFKVLFSQWDKDKLIDYTISITKAMAAEKDKFKNLAARHRSTQNWLHGLTLVEEIGQHLASTLDLNEVLALLLRGVSQALDVEDGSILLVEEPSGDLMFQISLGSISEEIKPFRVPRGQGIAGEVALTGVPIRVDNAQQDSRHFNKIDLNTGFLTQSILCVPLVTSEKIIGVVEVFNKKTGP